MAGLSVYTGVMGSGKTYEVVEKVIAANLKIGRRIVTNIAGLNLEALREFCGPDAEFGELVCVDHDRVVQPGFYPKENSTEESVVKGGDVVVLDEVWRWYGAGEKLPDGHLEFFRMHRHFVDPDSGYTCDIVLITQDIGDLHRMLRAVVEKVFACKKHKDLGMHSLYRVDVYGGRRLTKASLTTSYQCKYRKEVFVLYKSHTQSSGAKPVERDADSRGSIFGGALFKVAIPVSLVVGGFGLYVLWGMFNPEKTDVAPDAVVAPVSPQGRAVPPGQVSPSPHASSDKWRIVGTVTRGATLTVLMTDGQRIRRVVDPSGFRGTPDGLEIVLPEGGIASPWSGAKDQPRGFYPGNAK